MPCLFCGFVACYVSHVSHGLLRRRPDSPPLLTHGDAPTRGSPQRRTIPRGTYGLPGQPFAGVVDQPRGLHRRLEYRFRRSGHGTGGARYTVMYFKQDGQWYLESVREAITVPPTNFEHLQDLAFLIGDWTEDVAKGGAAKASYSLAAQGNFLVNTFDLTMQDVSIAGGVQWIGWDTAGKKARSWTFLFNGGFAEAVWAKDANTWKIALTATMRDGKTMTATNVLTKIDADHFSVQFIDRKLDGQPLPDEQAVAMKRVQ